MRLLLALFLILAAPALAQAPEFPALTGRVVDEANILSPEERAALDSLLAEHERKTTNQIVVVTLASLRGREIEEYGVDLLRHWGIGQREENNGALLIVAPNERKVRIEAGYGLEGDLTDLVSKLIIESSILPRFKSGDFAGGIRRGAEDIVSILEGSGQDFVERARERAEEDDTIGAAAMTLFLAVFMFVWLSVMIRAFRGEMTGRRGSERGRGGPVIVFGPDGGGFSGGSGGGFSGGGGGGFSGGGGSGGGGGASGSW